MAADRRCVVGHGGLAFGAALVTALGAMEPASKVAAFGAAVHVNTALGAPRDRD